MEWRTKALATEQAFVAFAGERAGTRSSGSGCSICPFFAPLTPCTSAAASARADMGRVALGEENDEWAGNAPSPGRQRREDAKLAAQVHAKR